MLQALCTVAPNHLPYKAPISPNLNLQLNRLVSPLPVNLGRLLGSRKQRLVVSWHESVATVDVAELEQADNLGGDDLQLQVGELLTDASVTAGTERKVGRLATLADQTVTVIDLLLLSLLAKDGRGVGGIGVPAVRVPVVRVGEVLGIGSADTRGGKQSVSGGNDIFGTGDGHGLLDSTQDGVDRSVQTQGLLDDGLVERQFGKILVSQRRQVGTEGLDLLLVQLFHDVRVLGKTQHDPGASG